MGVSGQVQVRPLYAHLKSSVFELTRNVGGSYREYGRLPGIERRFLARLASNLVTTPNGPSKLL